MQQSLILVCDNKVPVEQSDSKVGNKGCFRSKLQMKMGFWVFPCSIVKEEQKKSLLF